MWIAIMAQVFVCSLTVSLLLASLSLVSTSLLSLLLLSLLLLSLSHCLYCQCLYSYCFYIQCLTDSRFCDSRDWCLYWCTLMFVCWPGVSATNSLQQISAHLQNPHQVSPCYLCLAVSVTLLLAIVSCTSCITACYCFAVSVTCCSFNRGKSQ